MKTIAITLALLATTTAAMAQRAPELTGTWTGQWRTIIFGNNPHHPGSQTTDTAPRMRDITFTLDIQGQNGRLLWGHSWSDPARKEPFAATLMPDGKTIIGSDTDGSLSMQIIAGRNEMEACYTHTALGPSKSIVASCGDLRRQR